MDRVTVAALERQAKDHGFSISMKVKENGQAVVTLKDAYTGVTVEANSGDRTGHDRYDIALAVAVERMLDYQYRSKPGERPALGVSRF